MGESTWYGFVEDVPCRHQFSLDVLGETSCREHTVHGFVGEALHRQNFRLDV